MARVGCRDRVRVALSAHEFRLVHVLGIDKRHALLDMSVYSVFTINTE
jgi:hypothetical protein